MKKLVLLLLLFVVVLSTACQRGPRTVSEEEYAMLMRTWSQVDYAYRWGFETIDRSNPQFDVFMNVINDLNHLRQGLNTTENEILMNERVYTELWFVYNEEEARALEDVPYEVLVA